MSARKSENLLQRRGPTASDAPAGPEGHPDADLVNPFGCGPTPIELRDPRDRNETPARATREFGHD